MHITLLTYGTRGDTQPFLALALVLKKAGHTVRLAAPERFSDLAAHYAVPFSALAGDPAQISLALSDAGANVFRMAGEVKAHVFAIAAQVVRQARAALQGTDLLVHSFLFTAGAHALARELGIPDVSIQTFPIFAPTRAFPSPAFSWLPPGALSSLSHRLAKDIFWHGGNLGYQRLRRASPQDLPVELTWPYQQRGDRPPTPLLFAYSPAVLPVPADWSAPHLHVPGYFFLDEPQYSPPPALSAFLEAGEPPICFSFGSSLHRASEHIGSVVLAALEAIQGRAVILSGWGGWQPASIPGNVLFQQEVPHDWLFPRCRAVVHHGGAGTTGAGLRAGVPNLVLPHASDQPFWGRRVAALGAGPRPIPVKDLHGSALVAALQQVLHDLAMRKTAAGIGERIRSEDGCAAAVRLIEAHAAAFRS